MAARDKDGYGLFGLSSKIKSIRAHRLAWLLVHDDPGDFQVLHKCDNPACCNPDHLFLGTPLENMRDKVAKGRHISGMSLHPEKAAKGERQGNARLTEKQVVEIRRRYRPRQVTLQALANEFGVSFTTIHYVLRTGWKHVS